MPEKEKKKDKIKNKKRGTGVIVVITSILIVAGVLFGFFYIIIKNNVSGIADKYRGTIQMIPVLNKALPEVPDPEDPKNMSEKEITEKYVVYRDLSKELRTQLEEAEAANEALIEENLTLKSEADFVEQEREKLEKLEMQLKEDREQLGLLAAQGNTEGFKDYFEALDPDTAKQVYEQVIKEEKADSNAAELAMYYENMKPSEAAAILEGQGISEKDSIIRILVNMDREASAKILSAMSESFSSKLSKELTRYYFPDNDGQT